MVYDILKKLEAHPGKLDKIAILNENKDNETLKTVVKLALDPFILFYMNDPEMPTLGKGERTLDEALEALSTISNRFLTGNAAKEFVHEQLLSLSVEDAEVIRRVINKDLECGVAESTANKVWPKLIPVYPCLLASQMDDKVLAKLKFPCYSQKKEDGMRFNAIVKDSKCEFRSRNGKLVTLHNTLEQEFLAHGQDGMVYDGELLVLDANEPGTILDRKSGNGILNKSVKGTISPEEANRVVCTIWDAIPYDDFINLKSDIPYNQRWTGLQESNIYLSEKIALVESQLVNSIEEAQTIFQGYLNAGHEGSILKSCDLKWSDTRSKDQIKLKAELDATFEVIDWLEGTGKNVGKLGSLTVKSSDGLIVTNVGSGFNDEDRNKYTRDMVIGKFVDVKYNARIRDKNSNIDALFLPVFLGFREDRTANSSKEIK